MCCGGGGSAQFERESRLSTRGDSTAPHQPYAHQSPPHYTILHCTQRHASASVQRHRGLLFYSIQACGTSRPQSPGKESSSIKNLNSVTLNNTQHKFRKSEKLYQKCTAHCCESIIALIYYTKFTLMCRVGQPTL